MELKNKRSSTSNDKLNVFLDLDNTIIYSEEPMGRRSFIEKAMKFDHAFVDPYMTIARPYLQVMLDYLFKNCNVSIWTAGDSRYASIIYDKFIKKYNHNRQVDMILYSDHVMMSRREKGSIKDLSMLWDYWKMPEYRRENTIIIDDNDEVYNTQPDRCIHVKPFTIDNGLEDNEIITFILPKIRDFIKNTT